MLEKKIYWKTFGAWKIFRKKSRAPQKLLKESFKKI